MANFGNTGQRYKNQKLISTVARGKKVVTTLECGHSVEATWDTPEQAARVVESSKDRIGKRQRCTQCK